MNNKLKIVIYGFGFLLCISLTVYTSNAQSIDSEMSSSSCEAGGEIWVCGTEQQSQVHSDYDRNCGDYTFSNCTVIKTVIDVCTPNMRTSRIIEGDPNSCRT